MTGYNTQNLAEIALGVLPSGTKISFDFVMLSMQCGGHGLQVTYPTWIQMIVQTTDAYGLGAMTPRKEVNFDIQTAWRASALWTFY